MHSSSLHHHVSFDSFISSNKSSVQHTSNQMEPLSSVSDTIQSNFQFNQNSSVSIHRGYCPNTNSSLIHLKVISCAPLASCLIKNNIQPCSFDKLISSQPNHHLTDACDFDDFDLFSEIARDIQNSSIQSDSSILSQHHRSSSSHLSNIFSKNLFWLMTGLAYGAMLILMSSILMGCDRNSEQIQTMSPTSFLTTSNNNSADSINTSDIVLSRMSWRRWFIDRIEDNVATIIQDDVSEHFVVNTSQLPTEAKEGDYFLSEDRTGPIQRHNMQFSSFNNHSISTHSMNLYASIGSIDRASSIDLHENHDHSAIQLPDCSIHLCILDNEYKETISMNVAEKRYDLIRNDTGEDFSL